MKSSHKKNTSKKDRISLSEAISMAIGTMVGASIFSIFGVGAEVAGTNLPLVFIISGLLALLVGYSYAKLGSKIVSNAGPIEYIIRGIGDNVVTGSLSILMWVSYVISLSLFSKGFAGYFIPLFGLPQTSTMMAIVEIAILTFFTVLNFLGSKAVGKLEFYIVLIKLSILGIFIAVGIFSIKASYLQPQFDSQHLKGMLDGAALFFLSYMGFGLVTNASENINDPRKNVPKAIFLSIIIVIFIYISITIVALGNLPIDQIIEAQENALAVASRPFIGDFGFILVSVGALFSISSAMNATLYGGANVAYSLAKMGELPEIFERKVWFNSTEGLFITSGLSLFFTLSFDMSGIASITCAIYIIIYMFVIFSHYKMVDFVGGKRPFIIINLIIVAVFFVILMIYQYNSAKMVFWGTIITLILTILLEVFVRYNRKRTLSIRRFFDKD